MKTQLNQCNVCGKTVADYAEAPGWVQISAGNGLQIGISVSNGARYPILKNLPHQPPHRVTPGPMDFCGRECLLKFLAGITPPAAVKGDSP